MTRAAPQQPGADDLTWGLCVATLNRQEALEECVRRALIQTIPPVEIVIVDASETWEAHRASIREILDAHATPPRLAFFPANRRSSAAQRNQAMAEASADVLFFIDDDSWMAADCAERILETYSAAPKGDIAAVAAMDASFAAIQGGDDGRRDVSGVEQMSGLAERMGRWRRSAAVRWVFHNVLLFSNVGSFVPFDVERPDFAAVPKPPGAFRVQLMSGHTMTVRREVALAEPFEGRLLAYSPAEDLDACYRWGRRGAIFAQTRARLYHHRAATARLKRKQVVTLTLLNVLFFVRRSSSRQVAHGAAWVVVALRRLLADLLKDLMKGRLSLPQFRGVLHAMGLAPLMFLQDRQSLGEWYERLQARILAR